MPPASLFLLAGVVVATVLCMCAWLLKRPDRSRVYRVDDFREVLRAITPRERV